jgi:hypothetical protein
VRRAVTVLLVLATVGGFVFNAFTLLLPKLMQEGWRARRTCCRWSACWPSW